MRNRRAFGALAAATAGLLCSAVLAASAVERPDAPAVDSRVGAAGLSQSALLDEQAAHRTTQTTVVVTLPPVPTSAGPATTTTTAKTARTTTSVATTATLPPGAPLPSTPPPTGIPNMPAGSSWSNERDGVSARLRIEPSTPTAGQAVKFLIDVSSAEACCTILLDFGDGSDGFDVNNGAPCGTLPPGPKSATTSHVFASAGAYKATLTVLTGFACMPPLQPGESPTLPPFHSVSLTACIAVGPGATAQQQGCSPFPTFGPDSIISPVLDPFCQVRSDCTQASPPR